MNYKEAIDFALEKLKETSQPAETARYFLRYVTGRDLADIIAYPEVELSESEEEKFRQWVEARTTHMPASYIRGKELFCGLNFKVDERVLIPRPETEILVEKVIGAIQKMPPKIVIADVGTGSGAIGITIAKNFPEDEVYLVDISSGALEVAKENAKLNGVKNTRTLKGNLLDPLPEKVDVVVSNLPYVPSGQIGSLALDIHHFEPRLALEGGPDGLDLYREIFQQAPKKIKEGGKMFLEIGEDQGEKIVSLAKESFPTAKVLFEKDWAGLDRFVYVDLEK